MASRALLLANWCDNFFYVMMCHLASRQNLNFLGTVKERKVAKNLQQKTNYDFLANCILLESTDRKL